MPHQPVAQLLVNIRVFFANELPQLVLLLLVLRRTALEQQNRRNRRHNFQIAPHVRLLALVRHLAQIHLRHQHPVDQQCLINAADHHILLHRLVFTPDEVVVQVFIHIVHFLHHRQRLINVEFIHIERVLRQVQPALVQQRRAVDDRVHQQIFADFEARFIPAEHAVLRHGVAVLHDVLVLHAHFVVDVVANQHVNFSLLLRERAQLRQHALQALFVHPVVRIDDLEVQPGRVFEAGHHRVAMAAVLLVDGANDGRVLLLIFRRNIRGFVL